jgi:single-stranded-DNA-specific exonuclease
VLADARQLLSTIDLDETYGIVLAAEDWHPGVIGIVASKLVEEFGRPTVLVALAGNEGRGSGRSIPAFDLHGGLAACADVLLRYGGHHAAAGVTVARERVSEFAHRFNSVARERLHPEDLLAQVRVDLEVSVDDVTPELESFLRHFEPCGVGNPAPALLARGVQLAVPARPVGQDGVRLRLARSDGTGDLGAVAWGVAHRLGELESGGPVDIVFRVEQDEWQGDGRVQAKITDFRA